MPTFGRLREVVLSRTRVENHFQFMNLSPEHEAHWERINRVEFERGYKQGEYEKPGTPSLCDMELLTEAEFQQWLEDFKKLPNVKGDNPTNESGD